jgi:hypothetical protein
MGICGRHLALHEQLLIIKKLASKVSLIRLAYCFKVFQYDILEDYFISNLNAKYYLKRFTAITTYEIFLSKWIRWPISSDISLHYWEKCLELIK